MLSVDSVAQCHTLFYVWETKEIKSSSPIPDEGPAGWPGRPPGPPEPVYPLVENGQYAWRWWTSSDLPGCFCGGLGSSVSWSFAGPSVFVG